jgi:hypothetical protein
LYKPLSQSQNRVNDAVTLKVKAIALITVMAARIPDNSHRYAVKSEALPGVMILPIILLFEVVPSRIHAAVPQCSFLLYEPSLMIHTVPFAMSCSKGSYEWGKSTWSKHQGFKTERCWNFASKKSRGAE